MYLMYLLHQNGGSKNKADDEKDDRCLSDYPIPVHLWGCVTATAVTLCKVYGKTRRMGAKSRRNERGYDWGSYDWYKRKKGYTHYPVPDSFTVSR